MSDLTAEEKDFSELTVRDVDAEIAELKKLVDIPDNFFPIPPEGRKFAALIIPPVSTTDVSVLYHDVVTCIVGLDTLYKVRAALHRRECEQTTRDFERYRTMRDAASYAGRRTG